MLGYQPARARLYLLDDATVAEISGWAYDEDRYRTLSVT